jgi:hypothetical protein
LAPRSILSQSWTPGLWMRWVEQCLDMYKYSYGMVILVWYGMVWYKVVSFAEMFSRNISAYFPGSPHWYNDNEPRQWLNKCRLRCEIVLCSSFVKTTSGSHCRLSIVETWCIHRTAPEWGTSLACAAGAPKTGKTAVVYVTKKYQENISFKVPPRLIFF